MLNRLSIAGGVYHAQALSYYGVEDTLGHVLLDTTIWWFLAGRGDSYVKIRVFAFGFFSIGSLPQTLMAAVRTRSGNHTQTRSPRSEYGWSTLTPPKIQRAQTLDWQESGARWFVDGVDPSPQDLECGELEIQMNNLQVSRLLEDGLLDMARSEGWSAPQLRRAATRLVILGEMTARGAELACARYAGEAPVAATPAGVCGQWPPIESLYPVATPVFVGAIPTHIASAPLPVNEMLEGAVVGRTFAPTISGNNGSWTNTDDVVPQAAGKRSRKKAKARAKAVAQQGVMVGRGDYRVLRKLAAAGGRALTQEAANMMGVPQLGPPMYRSAVRLGKSTVDRLRRLFKGEGDYEIRRAKVNSLVKDHPGSEVQAGFGPLVGDACVELALTETLFTVFAPAVAGAYANVPVYINPANPLFQFLSIIGSSFEYVEWVGLVFEYEATCSDFITGSALGSVVSSMEYNPTNPLYTTMQAHRNADNAIYAKPTVSQLYGVECAPGMNPVNRYAIRNFGQAVSALTEIGVYQLGIQVPNTIAPGSELGILKASYHVRLSKARPSPLRTGYYREGRTGATNALPLGAVVATPSLPARARASQGSLSQGSGVTVTSTAITFPSVFQTGDVVSIRVLWNAGSSVVFTPPSVTLTNFTAYQGVFDNGQFHQVWIPQTGATCTYAALELFVRYTGNGIQQGVVTFGTGGTLPTNARVDIVCNVEVGGVEDYSL